MFKALGNPHRLAVFHRLATCCPPGTRCSTEMGRLCVGDLCDGLGIAQSTLSHHLRTLRQAGLIRMERSGKEVHCWVPLEVLESLAVFFQPNTTPTA